MRTLGGLWLGALCAFIVPTSSSAQSCVAPEFVWSLPADGAVDVPTNAILTARYALTATYGGERVDVSGIGAVPVETTFNEAGRVLVGQPLAPLEPSTAYTIVWPSLWDHEGESRGSGATTEFTTGAGPDSLAPSISAITSLTWDVDKDYDACSDDAAERYVFTLELAGVADDAPTEFLELIIFQTRGPSLGDDDPPERVLSIPYDHRIHRAEVRLPRAASIGRVCFAAVVRDTVDQVSPATPERCTTTTHPPFFEGCSTNPETDPAGVLPWLLLWTLSLTRLRRCPPGNPR